MLFKVWCKSKYYYSFRPNLCFSSFIFNNIMSNFYWSNFETILNKKVRTVAVQKWNISKDICDCLHLWLFGTTSTHYTVHSFLYVHIRFRTFKIAIRSNWNNNYNITNVPTTLYMSQMKGISGWHYFLHLVTNSTPQHKTSH